MVYLINLYRIEYQVNRMAWYQLSQPSNEKSFDQEMDNLHKDKFYEATHLWLLERSDNNRYISKCLVKKNLLVGLKISRKAEINMFKPKLHKTSEDEAAENTFPGCISSKIMSWWATKLPPKVGCDTVNSGRWKLQT